MKPIKWGDVAVHTALGVAVATVLFAVIGLDIELAILLNLLFWLVREIIQHKPDIGEVITHPQSLLEWTCPAASGAIICAVITTMHWR